MGRQGYQTTGHANGFIHVDDDERPVLTSSTHSYCQSLERQAIAAKNKTEKPWSEYGSALQKESIISDMALVCASARGQRGSIGPESTARPKV